MRIDGKKDTIETPILFRLIFATAGFVVGFIIISIFISTFSVADESMLPSYKRGSYVFVLKHFSVKKGDAVIYATPAGSRDISFKRIAAMPGETVEIRSKELFINGIKMQPGALVGSDNRILNTALTNRDEMPPRTLTADEYFLLGDNQNSSFDSRDTGPVKKSQIIGKAFAQF